MTLQEYFNQSLPVKTPHVEILNTDYTVLATLEDSQLIRINGLNYEYIIKSNDCQIYTTDNNGNARRKTCFFIQNPIFLNNEVFYDMCGCILGTCNGECQR